MRLSKNGFMPLLKNNDFIKDDWRQLEDQDALPDHDQIIVPWEKWQKERQRLLQSNAALGILFPNEEDPQLLADDLAHFQLIALSFPAFRDGRAFSQARILREEMGFEGELRATGDLLADQAFFMLRCGFNAFALPDGADEDLWQKATSDFSLWYQPTQGGKTIWELRAKK